MKLLPEAGVHAVDTGCVPPVAAGVAYDTAKLEAAVEVVTLAGHDTARASVVVPVPVLVLGLVVELPQAERPSVSPAMPRMSCRVRMISL